MQAGRRRGGLFPFAYRGERAFDAVADEDNIQGDYCEGITWVVISVVHASWSLR